MVLPVFQMLVWYREHFRKVSHGFILKGLLMAQDFGSVADFKVAILSMGHFEWYFGENYSYFEEVYS